MMIQSWKLQILNFAYWRFESGTKSDLSPLSMMVMYGNLLHVHPDAARDVIEPG